MKDWVEAKRKEMQASVARLRARADRIEAHLAVESRADLADSVDRAQLHDNDEVVSALGTAASHDVAALEAALQRIEAGTYGLCVECGEHIAKERLMALPAAIRCEKCATAHAGGAR